MPLLNCRRGTLRRVFGGLVTASLVLYLYAYFDTRTKATTDEQLKSKRHLPPMFVAAPLSGNPHDTPDVADGTNTRVKQFTKNDGYLEKLVVLTTTNHAYVDVTENWLSSIRRTGNPHPNIHIVAEDELAYDALCKSTANEAIIHIQKAPDFVSNMTLIFDTPEYKKFCNKRPQYILNLLKSGQDVLFSDVDILWFEQPYGVFYDEVNQSADMFIMEDQAPPKQIFCAGFVMYRSTDATIRWVEKWISELERFQNNRPDQVVLNMMVMGKIKDVPDMKLEILNPEKFTSGRHYFNATWRDENPHIKPTVLHNNWIVGHDEKVRRFKELGKWYN